MAVSHYGADQFSQSMCVNRSALQWPSIFQIACLASDPTDRLGDCEAADSRTRAEETGLTTNGDRACPTSMDLLPRFPPRTVKFTRNTPKRLPRSLRSMAQ